jgi:hypothetical protein
MMKLLEEAEQFLLEYTPERLGFAGRFDASGVRGKGLERKPKNRDGDFPYDHDTFYGSPQAYDRGSNHTGEFHGIPTPKDDEHFSLNVLDLEELVREVLGSPILFARSNSSNLPSSVPGSSGGWAHPPKKPWDDEERIPQDDDVNEDMDPEIPPTEPPMNPGAEYRHDQTDDDLENKINRVYGFEDNPDFKLPVHSQTPKTLDPYSGGLENFLVVKGFFGLSPSESPWDTASRMAWKIPESDY